MFESLQHLLAEQTSPLELIYFIIAVCALAIVVAALIYAALMSILWALRLRREIRYHRVFLPTRAHLKAFLPEYLIAFMTSAVLTVTIAQKHDIVNAVLDYDVSELDVAEVQALFPLRKVPDEALRSTNASAASWLRPVLQAGRAGEVRRLVGVIVPEVARTERAKGLLRSALLIASILLIAVYLGWLAWGRVKSLKASPDAAVSYRPTLRRVATMGVVLALLLASPALVDDAELIADSALGALRHDPPDPEDAVARAVSREVDRQHDLQSSIWIPPGEGEASAPIQALIADLRLRLTDAERGIASTGVSVDTLRLATDRHGRALADATGELTDVRRTLDGQSNRITSLDQQRAALAGDLERLARETERLGALAGETERARADLERLAGAVAANRNGIDGLEGSMNELRRALAEVSRSDGRENMELLLVQTNSPPYTVFGAGRPVASGQAMGLHWLPAGSRYEVRDAVTGTTVGLGLGSPQAVQLFTFEDRGLARPPPEGLP